MNYPYFDGHCDTLSRCLQTGESLKRNSGQCDLDRLGKYRPCGQIFAMYHDCGGMMPQGGSHHW